MLLLGEKLVSSKPASDKFLNSTKKIIIKNGSFDKIS